MINSNITKCNNYNRNSRNTDLLSGKYFIRPSRVSIVEDPILCLLLIPSMCCNYINTEISKYKK